MLSKHVGPQLSGADKNRLDHEITGPSVLGDERTHLGHRGTDANDQDGIRASLRAAVGASYYLLGLLTAYYAGKISAKLAIVLVQKLGQATMSLVGGP